MLRIFLKYVELFVVSIMILTGVLFVKETFLIYHKYFIVIMKRLISYDIYCFI